jgi:DMSO/TMAO reductase YedYZ molybdopterin-dependent catalytic subunit
VQGWCGVAKWKGIRLTDVLDLAGPLLEGRYIKLTSWGLAQYSYGGKPLEPFYEVIDPILARHEQTILAYEFNDAPLPLRYGAPLRLRVETQLGYKMVKYLRSIELIQDYRTKATARAALARTRSSSAAAPRSEGCFRDPRRWTRS